MNLRNSQKMIKILQSAKNILSSSDIYMQTGVARNADTYPCFFDDPRAKEFSLYGALLKASKQNKEDITTVKDIVVGIAAKQILKINNESLNILSIGRYLNYEGAIEVLNLTIDSLKKD